MSALGIMYERRGSNSDDSSCSSLMLEECLVAPKLDQRPQLGARRISKLFRSFSTSKLGLNFSGHSSRSLCTDDMHSVSTADLLSEEFRVDDASSSIEFEGPSQASQTSNDSGTFKLCGIRWKSSKESAKYAQLHIVLVPEDTVVLVRRAPQRQRSIRRVVHSGISSAGMTADKVLQAKSAAKLCTDVRAVSMQPLSQKQHVRPVAASA